MVLISVVWFASDSFLSSTCGTRMILKVLGGVIVDTRVEMELCIVLNNEGVYY